MKRLLYKTCCLSLAAGGAAALASPPLRFTSTVQLAVQEETPRLISRAQKVVVEQFANALSASPELHGRRYEVRTSGNEIIFYLLSDNDMRGPMQQAIAGMIDHLNGRVRARGRSAFYRTMWTASSGGYLDVVFNDTYRRIVSIAAQGVPLRDLLKEIKARHGAPVPEDEVAPRPAKGKAKVVKATLKEEADEPLHISYLIPGECAERLVDWNFETDGGKIEAKSIDDVMDEVGGMFGLRVEKKNFGRSRTYIFSGSCDHAKALARHRVPTAPPQEILRGEWIPSVAPAATQVYFPLTPIGE